MRGVAFALLALLALPLVPVASGASAVTCFGAGSNVATSYSLTVAGQQADGLYSWPTTQGDTLVMVQHGFGGKASLMGPTLTTLSKAGAVAVAMDYRGASDTYKVFTGVEDTTAALQDFLAACPNLSRVVLWGTSMGGHISALVVMQNHGVVDYLVDDVGPTNVPELLATVAPGGVAWGAMYGSADATKPVAPDPCKDPTGTTAATNSCLGGTTLAQAVLAAYSGREDQLVASSPALNPTAWAGAGLTKAYLLYQSADPIVPSDHGAQLEGVLAANQVPVAMYSVPYRGSPHFPDPANPALYPNGFDGMGPAHHQSAGKELVLKIIAKQLSSNPLPVVNGYYTPEGGDPLPTKTVRTGNAQADAALAPAYVQADPVVKLAQGAVGKFTPNP